MMRRPCIHTRQCQGPGQPSQPGQLGQPTCRWMASMGMRSSGLSSRTSLCSMAAAPPSVASFRTSTLQRANRRQKCAVSAVQAEHQSWHQAPTKRPNRQERHKSAPTARPGPGRGRTRCTTGHRRTSPRSPSATRSSGSWSPARGCGQYTCVLMCVRCDVSCSSSLLHRHIHPVAPAPPPPSSDKPLILFPCPCPHTACSRAPHSPA